MTEGDGEAMQGKGDQPASPAFEEWPKPLERAPVRVAVFDLPSLFWTVAKAREGRDKGPSGAALAALRHARDLAGRLGCDAAVFAHERRPYWREAASVQGVRCVPERREVEGGKAFDGWKTTEPLIPYKLDRAKKDPALVEELAALSAALSASGFGVFVAEEGRPYDPDEPEGGQGSDGPRPTHFEADDVAASLARRIAAEGRCAVVVSNDHDLAQVLSLPEAGNGRVLLARVSGGDVDRYVTADEVLRNYGVPIGKLGDFLALAGDGDFKPYPGADRGAARRAAGIGEAAAREVLTVFGSFEAAVAAAIGDILPEVASKSLLRALALLKAGGRERADCAIQLARLRFHVPIGDDLLTDLGGDWTAAESALKTAAAASRSTPSEPEELPVLPEKVPSAGAADRAGGHRVTARQIEEAIEQGLAFGAEGAPKAAQTAVSPRVADEALLVLTEAEFWALASLPAALDAGLFAPPLSQVAAPVVLALRAGLVEYATAGLLVGKVSREVVDAVEQLSSAALAAQAMSSSTPESVVALARALRVLPNYGDLVNYGAPLRRVTI